jgi:hypothetical protein
LAILGRKNAKTSLTKQSVDGTTFSLNVGLYSEHHIVGQKLPRLGQLYAIGMYPTGFYQPSGAGARRRKRARN